MFKIVETLENGEKHYTAVPSGWENNGVLYWPNKVKESELIKLIKTSQSPSTNWIMMPCFVKATANSYLEGRQLEKIYASFADTDAEELYNKQGPSAKKMKRTLKQVDLNEKVKTVLQKTSPSPLETNFILNIPDSESTAVPSYLVDCQEVLVENEENEPTIQNQNLTNQVVFVESNENKEITDLYQKVENIEKEVNAINVKLDQILKLLGANNFVAHHSEIVFTRDMHFPLNDIMEVERLNNLLSTENVKNEMINRLSPIGGTTKTADGCKVMYKVIDFLFNVELLNKYSWTGSSKSTEKKECFQKLANIVDLIFDVIALADCRHSKERNASFLKDKILKHSTQRLQRKRKRGEQPNGEQSNGEQPNAKQPNAEQPNREQSNTLTADVDNNS